MGYAEEGYTEKRFSGDNKKYNVFLIGDSIREGYCKIVRDKLSDVADVFFPDINCRSSQFIICSMREWFNMFEKIGKVDLVLFNCGHWDTAKFNGGDMPLTSLSEYERNISIIIKSIRYFFPETKIIFATTTPVNPNGIAGLSPRSREEIMQYNDVAVKASRAENVEIADLYEFIKDWESDRFKDYAHLTNEGNLLIGEYVASTILKVLEK